MKREALDLEYVVELYAVEVRRFSMFGMDDPSKVVDQIRSYIAESRLELAEVMLVYDTEEKIPVGKDGNKNFTLWGDKWFL